MFGDLLGDLQKKQEDLKTQLADIKVVESINDGAITITVNAAREVLNIDIDIEKVNLQDKAEIEDLLIVALNNALDRAQAKETELSQSLVSGILPPGLENMFGS